MYFFRYFASIALLFLCSLSTVFAQTEIDGYCFEQNNRGYLNQVKINILEWETNVVKAVVSSDLDGHFVTNLPPGRYKLSATKDLFEEFRDTFDVADAKVFLKLEMQRKPGYLFDATIAEARTDPNQVVDAITNTWIEIYNRTKKKPELVIHNHPEAFFQHTFEQGNHYTILIRKAGFLTKRIEAYINIQDCILCLDGVRNLTPGVSENLTQGHKLGTLVANIEMERVVLDKRIPIQNIYYDYNMWDIRPDAAIRLDNAAQLLRDNPNLAVELGSHTDSRGKDTYNFELSAKRAQSAVDYIVGQGIPTERIVARGYGENKLINRCANGVACSEDEHAINRRTELRVTEILEFPEEFWTSLEDMIKRESGNGPMSPTQREAMLRRVNTDWSKSTEVKIPETTVPVTKAPVSAPSAPATTPETEIKNIPPTSPETTPKSTPITPVVQPRTTAQTPPTATPKAEPQINIAQWEPPFVALPADYSGYAIELAQSSAPLAPNAPVLLNHPELHVQKEKGKYCYYILYNNRLDQAYTAFNTTIKSKNAGALIASFRNGVKTYLKP